MKIPEHIMSAVWEAFWGDGNNQHGLERVVTVILEQAARIADETYEDAPCGSYDNGGTQDGWHLACSQIANKLRAQCAPTILPHVHTGIPADIMKAATDIAYAAETGVVVGSFPGAVYIARAILAERERCQQIAEHTASIALNEAEHLTAGRIADKIAGTL